MQPPSRNRVAAGKLRLVAIAITVALLSIQSSAAQDAGVIDIASASNGGLSERIIQIFLVVTALSVAPGLAMMVTCLPLIIIVLSIMRQGAGLQQSPPNMLIMGLALFLTYYVMEPVFANAWANAVQPLLSHEIDEREAVARAIIPFSQFMTGRVSPESIETLASARNLPLLESGDSIPLSLLIPSFVLSEIQRAFEIGFVILLPFLVIDLLVASILMAMGMMMVPPAIVSLPFKLVFFVITNGWVVIAGALVRSYS